MLLGAVSPASFSPAGGPLPRLYQQLHRGLGKGRLFSPGLLPPAAEPRAGLSLPLAHSHSGDWASPVRCWGRYPPPTSGGSLQQEEPESAQRGADPEELALQKHGEDSDLGPLCCHQGLAMRRGAVTMH